MLHSIFNRGVREFHDAEERRQINLLNISSAFSFTFTSFFLVINIATNNWIPVISNCLLLSFTVSMFFINKFKYHTASIYIFMILLAVFFISNAILLHNNLQYGIFLLMAFSILLINNKAGRIIMLAFEISLFIVYLLWQDMPSIIPEIPMYKTIAGALAFLITFAFMLEYFKERLVLYHKRLAIANKQLQESNRVKERMLSILSHDFYGPVGNLITSIDMLDEQLFSPEDFHNASGKLKMQLQVLSTSMRDVLHWSKMQMQGEGMERSNVDLYSTIQEVSLFLEAPLREKNLHLQSMIEEGITVYANKDDIKLIFRNLVSNAIKFSNTSGSIFINAEKNPGLIRISIKDEGTGMTTDTLNALKAEQFNFFSTPGTAKEKGTGLGLVLVREFIHKNNGELSIASERGKGSIFSVSLPVEA